MGLCASTSASTSDKYLADSNRSRDHASDENTTSSYVANDKFAPSLPPSWQLTEAESKAAIHSIFQEFDQDGNGHIDEEELGVLVREVVKRGGVKLEPGFSKVDISRIMQAFDQDGNGTVEEDELVNWILEGVGRTQQQRKAFARSTPLAGKLDKFLTAVARVAVDYSEAEKRRAAWMASGGRRRVNESKSKGTSRRRDRYKKYESGKRLGSTMMTKPQALKAVHAVFLQYDKDESGYLDEKELSVLLHQAPMDAGVHMKEPFSSKDVRRVMKAFDTDGDGVLEEEELASWMVDGMSRTEEERNEFAQTTTLARKLDEFLTSMIHLTTRWCEETGEVLYDSKQVTSKEKKLGSTLLTKAQALKAVHAIFKQYDRDESGYLDEDELAELLHKLPVDGRVHMASPFSAKDVRKVMQAFDEDDNGVLEEKELAHWVLEGMGRYPEERRAFARTTPLAAKLDEFLTAMIHLATDWCEEKEGLSFGPDKGVRSQGSAMNRKLRMRQNAGTENNRFDESWEETMDGMETELRNSDRKAIALPEVEEELDAFRERIRAIEDKLMSLTIARDDNYKHDSSRTLSSLMTTPSVGSPLASRSASHSANHRSRSEQDAARIRKLETMVETLCKKLDIRVELEEDDAVSSSRKIVEMRKLPHAQNTLSPVRSKRIETQDSISSEPENWSIALESERSDAVSEHHISFDTSSDDEDHSEDDDNASFHYEISFDNNGDASAII